MSDELTAEQKTAVVTWMLTIPGFVALIDQLEAGCSLQGLALDPDPDEHHDNMAEWLSGFVWAAMRTTRPHQCPNTFTAEMVAKTINFIHLRIGVDWLVGELTRTMNGEH